MKINFVFTHYCAKDKTYRVFKDISCSDSDHVYTHFYVGEKKI